MEYRNQNYSDPKLAVGTKENIENIALKEQIDGVSGGDQVIDSTFNTSLQRSSTNHKRGSQSNLIAQEYKDGIGVG